MGLYLDRALGDAYYALAMTSTGGHTAEMVRDEGARFGFVVEPTELGAPEPGSVEAAFADPGLGFAAADLRPSRGGAGPDRIRMQGTYLHTPVLDCYDGVLNTAASSVAEDTEG